MSKLVPIVKQQVTTINRLVDYINDVKPYHTKILDTRVTFLIRESVFVNVTDEIQTTIDMILNTPITYDMNDATVGSDGFNLTGFGTSKFGAPSGVELTISPSTSGTNTIVSGINEFLIIDTTRIAQYGLDYTISPDDALDDHGPIILPKLRATRPPVAEGSYLQPEVAPSESFDGLLTSVLSSAEYTAILNKSGIFLDEMFNQK